MQKEIEFPLFFRICLNDLYDNERDVELELDNVNVERYKQFGYSSSYGFYRGQSLYNQSLVGWNGHTEDGETLGTIEGH